MHKSTKITLLRKSRVDLVRTALAHLPNSIESCLQQDNLPVSPKEHGVLFSSTHAPSSSELVWSIVFALAFSSSASHRQNLPPLHFHSTTDLTADSLDPVEDLVALLRWDSLLLRFPFDNNEMWANLHPFYLKMNFIGWITLGHPISQYKYEETRITFFLAMFKGNTATFKFNFFDVGNSYPFHYLLECWRGDGRVGCQR